MDYVAILKQALQITWRNKALWLFGILLAIFGGSGGGGGNFANWQTGPNDGTFSGPNGFDFPTLNPGIIVAIIIALMALFFVLMLVGIVVRSVSRASLIGMVGKIEDNISVGIKDGWRIGWSAKAWHIFGVNVVIGVPVFVLAMVSLIVVIAPLLLIVMDDSLMPIAIILAIIFLLGWIFMMFVLGVIISPITEISWRYAVFGEDGVLSSIKQSLSLIRGAIKNVIIMLLVLFGVGIAWGIISFIIMVILLILGVLIGGIPALIGYMLTQESIAAVLAGVPVFLAILILPLLFASGLYLTFHSAVWTLFFRELEADKATEAPKLASPSSPTDEAVVAEAGAEIETAPPLVILDEPEQPISDTESDEDVASES